MALRNIIFISNHKIYKTNHLSKKHKKRGPQPPLPFGFVIANKGLVSY